METRKIAVSVYASAIPDHCFLVGSELRFGAANPTKPHVGVRITRTETKRLLDMRLGFSAAAAEIFGGAD